MESRTQISKSGRIILPVKLRRALDIQAGDEIVMRLENGSIRLIPLRQAVSLAQKTVRRYVPEGTSLVEALIEARREEAARD
jgi:AbrB family looped-hinge helix DNA binding protein